MVASGSHHVKHEQAADGTTNLKKSGYVIQLIASGGTRLVYPVHQTHSSLVEVDLALRD